MQVLQVCSGGFRGLNEHQNHEPPARKQPTEVVVFAVSCEVVDGDQLKPCCKYFLGFYCLTLFF